MHWLALQIGKTGKIAKLNNGLHESQNVMVGERKQNKTQQKTSLAFLKTNLIEANK